MTQAMTLVVELPQSVILAYRIYTKEATACPSRTGGRQKLNANQIKK